MENASKALIIAGAILLAILIIALGVYIFNQAKSTTNVDELTNQQAQAHNNTFFNYEGSINGTQAKALIDEIRTNNQSMPDLGDILVTSDVVSMNKEKDNTKLANLKNSFETTSKYTVTITDYQTTECQYKGYVTGITIKK